MHPRLTKRLLASSVLSTLLVSGHGAWALCSFTFPPQGGYTVLSGLIYEVAAGGEMLQLDLFLPKGVINPRLIVEVHGGSFTVGDKSGQANYAGVLANQGFAVANVNYRLATATTNQFPAAVQDVRCAVSWLKMHAPSFGYQAAKVGAIGYSAGGALVSLLNVSSADEPGFDSPSCTASAYSPSVAAVASYYGVYDLTSLSYFSYYLGGSASNNPVALAASPVTYVDPSWPPFMLLRGTADTIIPDSQQLGMAAALQGAGVPMQTFEVPDVPHGFGPFNYKMYPQVMPSACSLIGFFAQQLN